MKQLGLTLLFATFMVANIFAQEEPAKLFKGAKKQLFKYYSNTAKNIDNLKEAKTLIDGAVEGLDQIKEKDQPKVLSKAGEVYQEIVKTDLKAKFTDAATKSMNFYIKAANHPKAKSLQQNEAVKGLEFLGGNIFIQEGNTALQAGAFPDAQKAFANVLVCKENVDKLSNKSLFLIDPSQVNEIKFYAGYAAYLAEDYDGCKKYFEPLADAGFDESFVYAFLSKIYQEEGNNDAADKIINKGVDVLSNVKISDDLEADVKAQKKKAIEEGLKRLLIEKINFYLKTKQMAKLETELKKAIDNDPDNAQLPFTLGQVYEDLATKAFENKNEEEGNKNFEAAISYYQKTLEIDENYFDAMYQIGAAYFNNAVRVYKLQADLPIDADGQQKSKDYQVVIDDNYNKAWEAFKKAEQIKANDLLLIVALKQIYLRVNNMDVFNEYKAREEAVKADPKAELAPFDGHPSTLNK